MACKPPGAAGVWVEPLFSPHYVLEIIVGIYRSIYTLHSYIMHEFVVKSSVPCLLKDYIIIYKNVRFSFCPGFPGLSGVRRDCAVGCVPLAKS